MVLHNGIQMDWIRWDANINLNYWVSKLILMIWDTKCFINGENFFNKDLTLMIQKIKLLKLYGK